MMEFSLGKRYRINKMCGGWQSEKGSIDQKKVSVKDKKLYAMTETWSEL